MHKLHIWYRPEPRESAVPRRPSTSETFLGSVLVQYFDHVLKKGAAGSFITLAMSYPGIDGRRSHILEARIAGTSTNYDLRIHAPQFYRQMITYETLSDLLRHTLLDPCHENRAAWSEDAVGLVMAMQNVEREVSQEMQQQISPKRMRTVSRFPYLETYALSMLWAIHSHLRRVTPLPGAYPNPGHPSSRERCPGMPNLGGDTTLTEPRAEGWSSDCVPRTKRGHATHCFLDQFVRSEGDSRLQLRYMLATLILQCRTAVMGALGGE